jgi:phage terminase Nu1 subunit (DNA packaging protein)
MPLKPKPQADLETVNAALLGRVLGISRASIANLATDGILPRADRGLFNLPACVQAYLRHKLVKAKASDATVRSLVAERTRLTKTKADAAEVEVRKLAGELVPVADIEAAWLSVAGVVRARLLLIPSKAAPRIVALKTPAEAQALLRKEINAALAAIAATPAV